MLVLAIKICKRAALCICILFLCLSIAIVHCLRLRLHAFSLSLSFSANERAYRIFLCRSELLAFFFKRGKKKKRQQFSFSRTPLLRAHISPILLHLKTSRVVNVCTHTDVCKRTLSTLEQHPAQPRTGERFTREIRTRCRYV